MTQFADDGFVFQGGMGTLHHGQNTVRTALYRQMQEAHQFRRIAININDIVSKLNGVAGGKSYPIDTINRRNQTQQLGKTTDIAIVGCPAVGVNILAE